jgi:hypothetical protein
MEVKLDKLDARNFNQNLLMARLSLVMTLSHFLLQDTIVEVYLYL